MSQQQENLNEDRLITLAIHTLEYATTLKTLLESEGIIVELNNVNLTNPTFSAGVRVRIHEKDLPLALRIVENREIFVLTQSNKESGQAETILVPTDFSDHSLEAARAAFYIASKHNCEILFLHAYIDPAVDRNIQLRDVYTFDYKTDSEESKLLAQNEEKAMSKFIDKIKAQIKNGCLPAVKFKSVTTEGVPEEVIISYVKENDPYLIVMGTRDAERKERELIGSVTAEVLDSCRNVTMTIPSNCKIEDINKISEITFFANLDQNDIIAIDSLLRFLPDFSATINIMHITTKRDVLLNADRAVSNLVDYCQKNYPTLKFKKIKLDPHLIDQQIQSTKSQLFVVANRKRNMIARIFNPALPHRLLFRIDIPMLVIPV
ncbi:MAG: universal stress protein [Bacteroides sp.]|nr:universal stress protein [Bacteroides sp.]MDE5809369.1 universal stress protein [Muribaculaceae bacterium]